MMKMFLSTLLVVALTLTVAVAQEQGGGEEYWPTPFTAEEIRDEWVEGFWLDTQITTPQGVQVSRVEVVGWSASAGQIREVQLVGGQAGTPGPAQSAGWQELRDHASFARANTDRVRDRRVTPLGEFDGWTFTRREEDGSVSEFFFADGLPGPPILYSSRRDGVEVFSAVQVGRSTLAEGG